MPSMGGRTKQVRSRADGGAGPGAARAARSAIRGQHQGFRKIRWHCCIGARRRSSRRGDRCRKRRRRGEERGRGCRSRSAAVVWPGTRHVFQGARLQGERRLTCTESHWLHAFAPPVDPSPASVFLSSARGSASFSQSHRASASRVNRICRDSLAPTPARS
jgi:hypothetical protein